MGESGTGKELFARAIHQGSKRAEKPLIIVNCASIPKDLIESELFGHVKGAFTGATETRKGKFEQANGGTIFLDEIGDMPLEAQAKILRTLEQGEIQKVGSSRDILVDVRIIAATNKELSEEAQSGNFRQDLFYRLNVIAIKLPPLRDRPDDIPILAHHFLREFSDKFDKAVTMISPEAMEILESYNWKGNVRQLKNVIESAVLLADTPILSPELLPPEFQSILNPITTPKSSSLSDQIDAIVAREERRIIRQALIKYNGNITQVAKELQITRQTVYRKIEKYKL
jgi:transcriptional regulator with PAS, ATPase and Fis domain